MERRCGIPPISFVTIPPASLTETPRSLHRNPADALGGIPPIPWPGNPAGRAVMPPHAIA
jgi:hypothetical protein